ncbi:MAG TPA: outer membrane beta-barrel protein [Gemmatimonadaceae bacterium]|nr:outer membrane beta-barrel protein [Gemmatimonadaceae bacterium]
MKTRFVILGMLIAIPPTVQCQRLTLGANFGGASANPKMGSTDWKSGWSADANLGLRLTPKLGLRADANFAQNDLAGGVGIPGEARFNKVSYIASGVWQREELPGTKVMPYVLAGVGAVRVSDKGSDSAFTRFAGNVGAGVGYKLGRIGLRAEGRDLMYKFDRFGYSKTQNDLLWQAGSTVRM